MVAEKAADLIIGNEPLAPERLPFYRHQGATAHVPAGSGDAQVPA
jgi:choline dehydrogenase